VLALTVHDDLEHVSAMLQAGAAGYLTKDVLGDEVVQAVRAVATGEAVLSSTALKLLVQHLPDGSARPAYVPDSGEESLTCRELEVLRLVARGLSNAETVTILDSVSERSDSHWNRCLRSLVFPVGRGCRSSTSRRIADGHDFN
jgi:DNA-binding response OmpR family regulator